MGRILENGLGMSDGQAMTKCELCGSPVKVVGDTTLHYEPLVESLLESERLKVQKLREALIRLEVRLKETNHHETDIKAAISIIDKALAHTEDKT